MSGPRAPYTADDDQFLMKYIATYNPEKPGRMGNALYKRLVQDEEGKWPWSKRHSWQSWRERYKDNQYRFDSAIRKYQAKKGIRAHSSSVAKSSPKLEKATQTVLSQSERTQQSTARGPASSSQNPKTNQVVISKPAEETDGDVPIHERGENEETAASRRQQPEEFSQDRNPVARKTARKTVVIPQVPDESEDGEEKEDDEEDTESDGSERDDGPANDGKRKAEDPRVTKQAKRRKIRQTENQADKENESEASPAQEATGSAAKDTRLKDAASSQSSVVERSLELLKTLNKNGNGADINRQLELLTELLGTDSEGTQQVIALAKSQVSENLPSSFESGNTQSQELLYPRIEEQDRDFAESARPENVVPGSWNDGQAPTDGEPVKEVQNENEASKSSAPGSQDVQQWKTEGHRDGSMSIDDEPVSQPRGRAARKVGEEDFFGTPSPSPSPMKADKMVQSSPLEIIVSPSPRAQEPASSQNLEGHRAESHTQLPKRAPPRYQHGGFRSTFTPSRKHALPPGQPPDLDIDSDLSGTDIISDGDEPIKVMNKSQTMNASRPPSAKKTVDSPRHTQIRSHTPGAPALPIGTPSPIAQPSVQQKKVAPEPVLRVAKYAPSSVISETQVANSAVTPVVNSRKKNIGQAQSVISVSLSPPAPPTIPSRRRDSDVQTVPEEDGNARKLAPNVRAERKVLQRFTSETKERTRVASVSKSLNVEHNAITKDIKTWNVPPRTEKRKEKNLSETVRKPQASSLSIAVGEVTELKDSVLRSVPAGGLDKTDSIHVWRSEAQITSAPDEDVSMTTVSDPFLTIDLARRLRREEKVKEKETASAGKDRPTEDTRVRKDRRITFGGFPSANSPQIDLRKRALRSSLASNQLPTRRRLSFSPSSALAKEDEDSDTISKSRRASVNVTIDLAQEVPSPNTEIPPTDQTFINRAGLQVLLQTIAQNHRLALDSVYAVYEELMDLQATDHVCAEMRAAEVRAGEESIRRMKELRSRSSAASTPAAESEARTSHEPPRSASIRSSTERREADASAGPVYRSRSMSARRRSELIIERRAEADAALSPHASPAPRQLQRTVSATWTSPEKSGPDVSIVSVDEARTLSGRRRSELFITPADDDPTYVRLREQYAPPSASRAARYLRRKARARLSSGVADNAQDDSMELDEGQGSEKEEEEVTLALTQARSRDDVLLASAEEIDESYRLQPVQADMGPQIARADQPSEGAATEAQNFTVEEDEILLGDDEEAIEEMVKKKGALLVRLRMAELAQ